MKKLRDTLEMKAIASYYIKTLFLWKIDETPEKKYWQKGLSVLFRIMVQELHDAIEQKNIRYFWNKDNNLIENLKPTVQKIYVTKLNVVLKAIDSNNVDKVVSFLLSTDDFQQFKQSEFYKKQQSDSKTPSPSPLSLSQSQCVTDSFLRNEASSAQLMKSPDHNNGSLSDQTLITKLDIIYKKLETLDTQFKTENKKMNKKLDLLMDKISDQNDKILKLEMTIRNVKSIGVATALNEKDIIEITANEIKLSNKKTDTI